MSLNNEKRTINALAIELSNKVGFTRQTCGSWIRGDTSPEQSIKVMVGDVCLDLMVALARPGETFTLREISRVTGWSHERIRQIEEGALRKIKRARETKEVKSELE